MKLGVEEQKNIDFCGEKIPYSEAWKAYGSEYCKAVGLNWWILDSAHALGGELSGLALDSFRHYVVSKITNDFLETRVILNHDEYISQNLGRDARREEETCVSPSRGWRVNNVMGYIGKPV